MNAHSFPAFVIALLAAGPASVGARDAVIRFVVHVPTSTPADAPVFISGNVDPLGPWDPGALELARVREGTYSATLVLPVGLALEYKFTRGTWESVEKAASFEEIPNRRLTILGDETVEIEIANWRDQADDLAAHTVTGDLRRHPDFPAAKLGRPRTVLVFLPPGYESEPERRYPVLYMHDGQNLFDAATSFIGVEWSVDETVTRLVESGAMEPIIVVGIPNTSDRVFEYTAWQDSSGRGGGAELYADFIVNGLKPFIDRTYRTLPDRAHTGIAGSSLGGLASLTIAWTRPNVFSKVCAMSTSYGWADGAITRFIEERERPGPMRLWIDVGTREDDADSDEDGVSDLVTLHRSAVRLLAAKGFRLGQDLESVEEDGAPHNEHAWAARLPAALRFLFPPRPDPHEESNDDGDGHRPAR